MKTDILEIPKEYYPETTYVVTGTFNIRFDNVSTLCQRGEKNPPLFVCRYWYFYFTTNKNMDYLSFVTPSPLKE